MKPLRALLTSVYSMWGLFTRALTLASSTVRVSVINTSANFMLTALLGWMIFGEELPGAQVRIPQSRL